MKKTSFAILALTLLMVLFVSCASSSSSSSWYSVSRSGKELIVKLEGNPTTGYQWVSEIEGDAITESSYDFHRGKAPNGMVGVGGTFVITYTPVKAGDAKIKLSYLRVWETIPAIGEKELKVSVSESGRISVIEE